MNLDALLKAGAATVGAVVILAFLEGLVGAIRRKRASAAAPIIAAMERLGLEFWRRGDVMVYLDSDLGWRMLAFGTTAGGALVQWEIHG